MNFGLINPVPDTNICKWRLSRDRVCVEGTSLSFLTLNFGKSTEKLGAEGEMYDERLGL